MLEARDLWIAPTGAPDPVVRDCSLTLAPGEWIAVTGPNGCGKSTLALALAGLIAPRRGSLTWQGRSPVDHAAHPGERPILAVLQDPISQLLQPTVGEELAFTAANLGQDPATRAREVERWAARFGLTADLARDPRTLSAGNQQLVLVLAALIARPGLLVADEAGAHLDSGLNARLLDALDEERGTGLSVVWVTQRESDRARIGSEFVLGAPVLVPGPEPEESFLPSDPKPLLIMSVGPRSDVTGPRVRSRASLELPIPDRGVIGLTGANGAGKSVLLSCAAGVLQCPQVGIGWLAEDGAAPLMVGEHSETLVFEEVVADELRYAAVSRGRPPAEVDQDSAEMLKWLGFDAVSLRRRRTWTLSSGEKRLIELVAALVAPARLLVLDEPTAGLDPARSKMLAWLVRRRSRDSAVLLATQDMPWLASLGAEVHRIGD